MPDLPLFDPYKALEEILRAARSKVSPKLSPHVSPLMARDNSEQNQVLRPDFDNSSHSSHQAPTPGRVLPARPREERKKERKNSIKSYTYAGGGGEGIGLVVPAPAPMARAARPARIPLSHLKDEIISDEAPARVSGGGLREWCASLARLDPSHLPCPGYRTDEWPRTLSRAHAFLDTFGAQAEALGWTASRLFGVHPIAGIVRVDACGALVLPIGGPVRAITATEIAFGHLTHREKPGQPKGVPWWEFGR